MSLTQLCFLAAVAIISVSSKTISIDRSWPQWPCNGSDCPSYTVIEKKQEYELREYPAATWASIEMESRFTSYAYARMYMKMQDYIYGKNEEKIAMRQTIPVIVKTSQSVISWWEPRSYKLVNYISAESAPTPTNTEITLVQYPKFRVYVRECDSSIPLVTYLQWEMEFAKLKIAIGDSSLHDSATFMSVMYNKPSDLRKYNEVWVKAN